MWLVVREVSVERGGVRDAVGGIALIAIGLFVALYATAFYPIGTVQRMGPGFFPVTLGYILAGLGLLIVLLAALKPNVAPEPGQRFAWRAFMVVVASIAAFALLMKHLGLVPASLMLTFFAAFAEYRVRPFRTLLLGSFLALFALLIFRVGLGLPIPAFRNW